MFCEYIPAAISKAIYEVINEWALPFYLILRDFAELRPVKIIL